MVNLLYSVNAFQAIIIFLLTHIRFTKFAQDKQTLIVTTSSKMENNNFIRPVSLLRRITIMFYDSILLVALLFFASLPVAVPLEMTMEHPYYPLYILYIHLVAFLFFSWCWTRGGQTLGSKTWKIKVVTDSGNNVTWKHAFLRYIGSLLCWLSLGIGFLWCYTNKERRAWNDIISKTRLSMVSE